MPKLHSIAIALAVVATAACASQPANYGEPHYASNAPYYADRDFGQVIAIDREGGGHSSGAGAVLGGVIGGVLGHQVGSGRGNDAATVAGAVGGAVVGNEVEKRRAGEHYRVTVRFRDGREATYYQDDLNGIRVGDRVRLDGDRLARG